MKKAKKGKHFITRVYREICFCLLWVGVKNTLENFQKWILLNYRTITAGKNKKARESIHKAFTGEARSLNKASTKSTKWMKLLKALSPWRRKNMSGKFSLCQPLRYTITNNRGKLAERAATNRCVCTKKKGKEFSMEHDRTGIIDSIVAVWSGAKEACLVRRHSKLSSTIWAL